jgi:glutamate dehydrogenase
MDTTPFTMVGVGDMSGDVFGNGALLSKQIKLLAAFDHRHIFLDPTPDTAKSFAERERMFALPRSSWDDYNKDLISAGGGVFPRSARSIELSPQIRAALDIEETSLPPEELMHRILLAPVDLFYNGGIGTYIKPTTTSVSMAASCAARSWPKAATWVRPSRAVSNSRWPVAASSPMRSTTRLVWTAPTTK